MELHFTQLVPVGSKNVYLNLTLKFTLLYYLIQKKIAVLWVFLAAISDIRRHLLCKLQTFFPTTYVSIKMLKCVCFVGRERQSHYEVLTVEEKKGLTYLCCYLPSVDRCHGYNEFKTKGYCFYLSSFFLQFLKLLSSFILSFFNVIKMIFFNN